MIPIIITLHSTWERCKVLIDEIKEKTSKEHKLWVIANGVADNVLAEVCEYAKAKRFNLITLDEHQGIARIRNIVIRSALMNNKSPYFVMFDDDMHVVKKNWLTDGIKIMDDLKHIGVLGINCELLGDGEHRILSKVNHPVINLFNVIDQAGNAWIVRTDTFNAVGGFDLEYGTLANKKRNGFSDTKFINDMFEKTDYKVLCIESSWAKHRESRR